MKKMDKIYKNRGEQEYMSDFVMRDYVCFIVK